VPGGVVELDGSARGPASGARRIGDVRPDEEIELTLTLRGPDLPAADAAPRASPTRGELEARYGAHPGAVATLVSVLARSGLATTTPSGRSLGVRGRAGAVQALFGVHLGRYLSPGGRVYRGRVGAVVIPAVLRDVVTGVFGLDQRCMADRDHDASGPAPSRFPAGPPLAPEDLETRYAFPPGDASGQTVAVAEFGLGPRRSDLQLFCQKHERRLAEVTTLGVGVARPQRPRPPGSGVEGPDRRAVAVTADVETLASLCSGAKILVLVAPPTQKGWIDLLDRVVWGEDPPPVVLALAWGRCEGDPDWSASAQREIDVRLHLAAMLGTTVCASVGPATSTASTGRTPDFPATSPFAVSVGAHLRVEGADPAVTSWCTPGGAEAASIGCWSPSTVFGRPSWQSLALPGAPCPPGTDAAGPPLSPRPGGGRVVPDLTAVGGPHRVEAIVDGRARSSDGAGCSAVVWAALLARIYGALATPRPPRFVAPLLYGGGPGGGGVPPAPASSPAPTA